ncbi:MAG: hypothetical protein WCA19_03115 [Candidatus Acidiferrales bacterium]
MGTSFAETFIEVSGPESETGAAELQEYATSDDAVQVLDHGTEGCELDQLCLKKRRSGCLEGRDAALRLSNTPAPTEKPIDIPSLQLKLSSMLPKDRQLERRARKLASQLAKGRRVTCDWDIIFLSELTAAENCMSDEDFLTLYSDQVKTPTKKGGRPRKYKTAKAQRKGHAERQRRYRERKLLLVSGVTKTTSQFVER